MFETDKAKKNLLAFCDLDVVCRLSATNSSWRLCCQDLSFLSRADFSPFFSRVRDIPSACHLILSKLMQFRFVETIKFRLFLFFRD